MIYFTTCCMTRIKLSHRGLGSWVCRACRAGVLDVEQTQAKAAELGDHQQHLGTADLLPGTEGSSVPYQTQIYSR